MSSYGVRLAPGAVKDEGLPADARDRLRAALHRLATAAAAPGRIGGKSVKSIRGTSDAFYRLRVGELRVMYDVIDEDRLILVLGIVHRSDLERWLRNR